MADSNNKVVSTLYRRIQELASQKKVSLAEIERSLQFSNGIISTWKYGSPSIDKVEKVADYFHVSTDYLLGKNNDLNSDDQQVLAMFRKKTEGMSEEDKKDFNESLGILMNTASEILKNRRKNDN